MRFCFVQLEYGNKIAILGGDHLLAKACVGLANLRNPYIVELVSIAISDFTQSAFMGRRDAQGRLIPTLEQTSQEKWIDRNTLAHANLMARGCRSAVMLGKLKPEV
jgi:geranylgeranyl pyrophosphate synthase